MMLSCGAVRKRQAATEIINPQLRDLMLLKHIKHMAQSLLEKITFELILEPNHYSLIIHFDKIINELQNPLVSLLLAVLC